MPRRYTRIGTPAVVLVVADGGVAVSLIVLLGRAGAGSRGSRCGGGGLSTVSASFAAGARQSGGLTGSCVVVEVGCRLVEIPLLNLDITSALRGSSQEGTSTSAQAAVGTGCRRRSSRPSCLVEAVEAHHRHDGAAVVAVVDDGLDGGRRPPLAKLRAPFARRPKKRGEHLVAVPKITEDGGELGCGHAAYYARERLEKSSRMRGSVFE